MPSGGGCLKKPKNGHVNYCKPGILRLDHMLGILKIVRDGLEPKNYVHCLKLAVFVKEDLELEDSVEVCKVH